MEARQLLLRLPLLALLLLPLPTPAAARLQPPNRSPARWRQILRLRPAARRPGPLRRLAPPPLPRARAEVSFTRFLTLGEIHAYLDSLAARYPRLVSVGSLGRSGAGRALKAVRLSTGPAPGGQPKPAVFVDAGIHAREWLGPAVALYALYQLVENATAHAPLLDGADWYLLPVVNPDGYEYTHTHDRMWRKTRSFNGDPSCLGVDANRNFDFHWGEDAAGAAQCSSTYSGPQPLSEPESRALGRFLLARNSTLRLYLTLHSHGRLLLIPWGWSSDLPPDAADLLQLGSAALRALEAVRGTRYTLGSSANSLYKSFGTSRDFAKGAAGIKYAYTMELPEGGPSGFDPPPSDILPVATETFEAIRVMGSQVAAGG